MGYKEDERGPERMAVLKEGEKIAVSNEDMAEIIALKFIV